MKYLSIDRFEANMAICEDDEGRLFGIERSEMPSDAKEGNIIRIDDDGNINVDSDETKRRRNKILELQKKIAKK